MAFSTLIAGQCHTVAGLVLLLWVASLATPSGATDVSPGPCRAVLALTGDQVSQRLAAKNAERAQHLHSFEGQRSYSLDYTGFPSSRSAEMRVKVFYRAPGSKSFTVLSESGSKFITTRVFRKLMESEQESSVDLKSRNDVLLNSDNYRFSLRGCEVVAGRDLYVMDVEPKHDARFLYRGTIWVDAQDYAVTRIEAEPAKSPSFWTRKSLIRHQYQKIGEFYLPSLNETVTDVRLGGKAVLTIRYDDYKVNQSPTANAGK